MSMGSSIMLVDGLNLYTRHFVANPSMSDLGHHVGGTVGFLKSIQLLSDKINPSQICVIWEGGGSSRRRSIFPGYKKGRKPQKLNRFYGNDIPSTVENRNYQLAFIIELLKHTPVKQFYIDSCEADDIIGFLVKNTYKKNSVTIVSSDKDYYQLINENVTQWSPGQKRFIRPQSVVEKFHIPVHNFCAARCFVGDASDCIDGIKGAGFKTMAKRFPELIGPDELSVGDIISISKNMQENSNVKLYSRISVSPEIPLRNWRLMYLDIKNLSASQISKVKTLADTSSYKRDKIGFMRALMREGIRIFDTDSFFLSLNSITP